MSKKLHFRKTTIAGAMSFALAFQIPAAPANAQNNLGKALAGIGAILLLNEAAKGSGKKGGTSGGGLSQTAQIQKFLNDLGYDAGPVDGQPGKRTRTAIEQFQRDRGFPITGKLTRPQFAALQTNREAVVSPPGPGTISKANTFEAQVYLAELGFNPGNPDGVWGPRSQAALESYRASAGIAQQGMPLQANDIQNLHQQVHSAPIQMAAAGNVPAPSSQLMGPGSSLLSPNSDLMNQPGNNQGFGNGGLLDQPSGNGGFGGGGLLDASATTPPKGTVANAGNAIDPNSYSHVSERPVEGAANINRAIAVQIAKARPEILDEPQNLQQWFTKDHPRTPSGVKPTALRQAYDNGNQIERENILREFKSQLLGEIENTAPLNSENPLRLALYQMANYGEYADNKGLSLTGSHLEAFQWQIRTGYVQPFSILRADLPGTSLLPISREQASAMIDSYTPGKQRLFRVVWGTLSSIGQDENIASFAKSSGYTGSYQVPTTFSVDRVTLAIAEPGYRTQPKVGPAIHEFALIDPSEQQAVGQDLFAYLDSRGVPMKDGHVLVGVGNSVYHTIPALTHQETNKRAPIFQRLAYLMWLKQNPGFVSRDHNFALVAANVFNDAEKRQFFGDGANQLHYLSGATHVKNAFSGGAKIFRDEFAAEDAKQTFLNDIYPRIQAGIPSGKVPVMHVIGVTLGSYDFENENFPLIYDGQSGASALSFRAAALPVGGHNFASMSMHSADRIGPLPTSLDVNRDQARTLRERMGNSTKVYFVWTADLDLDSDGRPIESLYGQQKNQKPSHLLPGRGTVTRAGLFIDPELNVLLKEYDVASLAPSPETLMAQQQEPTKDPNQIQFINQEQLLKTAVNLIGDAELDILVANTHSDVRNADEFSTDERLQEARYEWANVNTPPIWFSWNGRLGRYDRETEKFPFQAKGDPRRIQIGQERTKFASAARLNLVGEDLFAPLDVPEDIARKIVESGARDVQLLVRADAVRARLADAERSVFDLFIEPKEVLYMSAYTGTGENQIIARREIVGEESFFEKTYTAADFPGLSGRQMLNGSTLALLRAKGMSEEMLDSELRGLMADILAYERNRRSNPDARFFDNQVYQVDDATFELHGDRFKSWVTARADALSNDFTVQYETNGNWKNRCGEASTFGVHSDYLSQQGINTKQMIVDAKALEQRALNQAKSAASGEIRHLFFMGRMSTEQQRCEPLAGIATLALENIGIAQSLAANQGAQYYYQSADFTLTQSEQGRSSKGIPLLELSGVVTETRFFNQAPHARDESNAELTIKGGSEQPDEAEDDVKMASFEGSKTDGTKSNETETNNAQAPIWPSLSDLIVSSSTKDSVGVKIGDTIADVDTIIAKDFDVTITYQTERPTGQALPGFEYMRVYIIDGGAQVIAVMSHSPDGPVMGISRHLHRNDGPWDQEGISASLIDKYSEPSARATDDSTMVWSASPDCAYLPLSPTGTRQFFPVGDGVINGDLDTTLAAQALGAIAIVVKGNGAFVEKSADCGVLVQYSSQPLSVIPGYSSIYTFMTDVGLLQQVQSALDSAKPKPKKIKF